MEAMLKIEATRRGVDRVFIVFDEGDEQSGFDLLARCASVLRGLDAQARARLSDEEPKGDAGT